MCRDRLLAGSWMGWVPSGGPSGIGLSCPGLTTLGGSHPSAAGSSVLLGVHGVQLASSASTCGSYQGPVLSSSSSLTLFLGCLPLRWLLVLVLGGCCGQLALLRALVLCDASISHMFFQYFSVSALGGSDWLLFLCH